MLPLVRKIGYRHKQEYPIEMAEKQARVRATRLAKSLKTKTADNIMKSCAPASAWPEGQPAKSCIKPSTKENPDRRSGDPGAMDHRFWERVRYRLPLGPDCSPEEADNVRWVGDDADGRR